MRPAFALRSALAWVASFALALALACSSAPAPEASAAHEPGAGAAPAGTAPDDGGALPDALPDGGSTASTDGGVAPTAASPDGGPAAVVTFPMPATAVVALVAGQSIVLPRDGTALVDPLAAFRIEVGAHLIDGRFALHDAQDAMVGSSGTTEAGAAWTHYQITPGEPLVPGSFYVLVLDGASTREAHDASGRAYTPLVLKIKTTGERPPRPAAKKRGKRRH